MQQLKKFIIRSLFLFVIPILVICISFELAFRNIPNTHKYKKEYMDKNSNSIEVLILGNSHAFDGINPKCIQYKTFNLAYHSQEFIFDELLVEKYIKQMKNLKCIVFTMSYFTLFEKDIHEWRANKYRIYCDIDNGVKIGHKFECLKKENFRFLIDYYLKGKDLIICDSLGVANSYEKYPNYDWEKNGKSAAQRHTLYKGDITNLYILNKINEITKKYDIQTIFITYPGWSSYYKNFNPTQWELTQKTMEYYTSQNKDLHYYNFISDSTFTKEDFMNVDHLNSKGAIKMSKKLNNILETVLRNKN